MAKFQILLKKKAFFLVGLALVAGGLFYAFSLPKTDAVAADCGYVYQGDSEWAWICVGDDVGDPTTPAPTSTPNVIYPSSSGCLFVWTGPDEWVWMCQADEDPADTTTTTEDNTGDENNPPDSPPDGAQLGEGCMFVWRGQWDWLCDAVVDDTVTTSTEDNTDTTTSTEDNTDTTTSTPTNTSTPSGQPGDGCIFVAYGDGWRWICETEEDDTSTSTDEGTGDEGNTGGDNGSGENGSGEGDENHELDIFNEMFSNVNDTTWIEITWETNIPATSRVVYGETSVTNPEPCGEADPENPDGLCRWGYEFTTVEDPTLVTEHTVRIEGLNPSTLYYMRPISHASPEEYGIELLTETTADNIPGGGGDGSSSGGSSSGSSSSGGSSSGGDGITGTGGSVEPQVLGETIEATEGDDSVGGGEEEEEAPKEVLGEFTSLPEAGIDYSLYVLFLALGMSSLAGAGVLAYRR